jgi:hypothetical protein
MSLDRRRYELGSFGAIRLLGDGRVAIELSGDTEVVPIEQLQFLLHFAEPSTLAEAAAFVDGASMKEVRALVDSFERRGLLVVRATDASPGESMLDHLARPYRSEEALATIRHHLSAGRCVVLENAFEKALAESVHASLAAYDDWRPDIADHPTPTFSFHTHRMRSTTPYPEPIAARRRCSAVERPSRSSRGCRTATAAA